MLSSAGIPNPIIVAGAIEPFVLFGYGGSVGLNDIKANGGVNVSNEDCGTRPSGSVTIFKQWCMP